MKAYKNLLKASKPWWDGERIELYLNQSNDHGLNWKKPAVLAILFTILFYSLMIISQFHLLWHWNLIPSTWWEYKKVNLILLNPTHSTGQLFGENKALTGYTLAWDYIQRLFLTYFIFQTVSAFRKYSK